jgi:hypothetical protein
VQLNIGDSTSMEATVITLRGDVWGGVARPIKDRRVFEYGNRCFYFGFKELDTIYVSGSPAEVRLHDVPCYPYLKRAVNAPGSSLPAVPVAVPTAPVPTAPPPAEVPAGPPRGEGAPAPPPAE